MVADADGVYRVYDGLTGTALSPPIPLTPDLISVALTDNGSRLVAMGPAGTRVIDVASGSVVAGPAPVPNYGVVTPDGELIGSDFGGSVAEYDAGTLATIRPLSEASGLVQELHIDQRGTLVVAKGGRPLGVHVRLAERHPHRRPVRHSRR